LGELLFGVVCGVGLTEFGGGVGVLLLVWLFWVKSCILTGTEAGDTEKKKKKSVMDTPDYKRRRGTQEDSRGILAGAGRKQRLRSAATKCVKDAFDSGGGCAQGEATYDGGRSRKKSPEGEKRSENTKKKKKKKKR